MQGIDERLADRRKDAEMDVMRLGASIRETVTERGRGTVERYRATCGVEDSDGVIYEGTGYVSSTTILRRQAIKSVQTFAL